MKIGARLFLFGTIVPTLGALVTVGIAEQLFARALRADVDRRLLAQAAVESVSLFDRPGGQPHLHAAESELPEDIRAAAGLTAVYDDQGRLVIQSPEEARVPPRLTAPPPSSPRLQTTGEGDTVRRELTFVVGAPDGRRYTLWIATSLQNVQQTLSTFRRISLLSWGALVLLLVLVQTIHGRWLARRIRVMADYLPRLWSGRFDPLPPDDPGRDELADLRAALRETGRQLKLAAESQSRFLANAAHELRTPLTLMRTEIDLALRRPRDEADLRRALGEVRKEVDRLAGLAGQLLELKALERRRPQGRCDLIEIASDATAAFAASARERSVTIDAHVPEGAVIPVEASSARQVLDNLLSNALKFAPPGSRVTVRMTDQDGGWALAVEDQGPGIPAEARTKVFEPFFRAGTEGTGLGLAIVAEIAAQHGGRAYVDDLDAGTRVVVWFPAAP